MPDTHLERESGAASYLSYSRTMAYEPRHALDSDEVASPRRTLPTSLLAAQAAVETQEVQEIIKRLADFNLAVFMPHMHVDNGSGEADVIVEMPSHIVQVEENLVNKFVPRVGLDTSGLLPVAWRYADGVIVCSNRCPHD